MIQRDVFRAVIAKSRVGRDGQQFFAGFPPHGRFGFHAAGELGKPDGGILGVEAGDFFQTLGGILGLPVPPHFVDEAVVEEEERVAGGGYAVPVLFVMVRRLLVRGGYYSIRD